MKKSGKRKKIGRIFERPILGMIVAILLMYAFEGILGSIANYIFGVSYTGLVAKGQKEMIVGDGNGIVAGSLCLLIFWLYNKKRPKDFFTTRNFGPYLLMGWSIFLVEGITLIENIAQGQKIGSIALAVLMGLAPGIKEEVIFRIIPIAIVMKGKNKEKHMWIAFFASGIIFSLIHILNIIAGADLIMSLIQAFYAFCVGLVFAAIYLRTGNMWITIFLHSITDIIAFLGLEDQQNLGVQVTRVGSWDQLLLIGFGLLYLINAIYIFRKSKRGEAISTWKEKWEQTEESQLSA